MENMNIAKKISLAKGHLLMFIKELLPKTIE